MPAATADTPTSGNNIHTSSAYGRTQSPTPYMSVQRTYVQPAPTPAVPLYQTQRSTSKEEDMSSSSSDNEDVEECRPRRSASGDSGERGNMIPPSPRKHRSRVASLTPSSGAFRNVDQTASKAVALAQKTWLKGQNVHYYGAVDLEIIPEDIEIQAFRHRGGRTVPALGCPVCTIS